MRSILPRLASLVARTPLRDSETLNNLYQSTVNYSTPDEPSWIDFRGYDLLVNPSDHIGQRLWMKGEYEPIIEDIISQCLNPGDVAFDVGANVGHFTLCMRDEVGSEGSVHAYEPTPANIDLLSNTVRTNEFKNVTVIPKAVGTQHKTMNLHIEAQNTGNSTLFPNREYEETVEVDVIPLSDHIQKHGFVDFIKIDIQGGELNALDGIGDQLKNVGRIYMEIHHFTDGHQTFDIERLFHQLADRGRIKGIERAPTFDSSEPPGRVQSPEDLASYQGVLWINDREIS